MFPWLWYLYLSWIAHNCFKTWISSSSLPSKTGQNFQQYLRLPQYSWPWPMPQLVQWRHLQRDPLYTTGTLNEVIHHTTNLFQYLRHWTVNNQGGGYLPVDKIISSQQNKNWFYFVIWLYMIIWCVWRALFLWNWYNFFRSENYPMIINW